jgi:hypothetical protein
MMPLRVRSRRSGRSGVLEQMMPPATRTKLPLSRPERFQSHTAPRPRSERCQGRCLSQQRRQQRWQQRWQQRQRWAAPAPRPRASPVGAARAGGAASKSPQHPPSAQRRQCTAPPALASICLSTCLRLSDCLYNVVATLPLPPPASSLAVRRSPCERVLNIRAARPGNR